MLVMQTLLNGPRRDCRIGASILGRNPSSVDVATAGVMHLDYALTSICACVVVLNTEVQGEASLHDVEWESEAYDNQRSE